LDGPRQKIQKGKSTLRKKKGAKGKLGWDSTKGRTLRHPNKDAAFKEKGYKIEQRGRKRRSFQGNQKKKDSTEPGGKQGRVGKKIRGG